MQSFYFTHFLRSILFEKFILSFEHIEIKWLCRELIFLTASIIFFSVLDQFLKIFLNQVEDGERKENSFRYYHLEFYSHVNEKKLKYTLLLCLSIMELRRISVYINIPLIMQFFNRRKTSCWQSNNCLIIITKVL